VQDLIFLLAHSLFGVYRSSREKEVKEGSHGDFLDSKDDFASYVGNQLMAS